MLVFAVHLNWLPALGVGSPKAIVLPAVSLGIAFAAAIARVIRSTLIDALQQPYILVARAKGLSERAIVFRHALKNAFISVVTILGLQFGAMISGAAVIEVIYARPGLGSYLVERDPGEGHSRRPGHGAVHRGDLPRDQHLRGHHLRTCSTHASAKAGTVADRCPYGRGAMVVPAPCALRFGRGRAVRSAATGRRSSQPRSCS